MARYDLLRAVAYLATCITKWTEQCNEDLYRLICYINSTAALTQVSWIGDELKDLKLRLYVDADFAGCERTQRSTTGVVLFLSGKNSRFMLGATSKRQTAVSNSTAEAEMIAGAFAIRSEGIPAMELMDTLGQNLYADDSYHISLEIEEDNEAMQKLLDSGTYSQKLRHASRTHRTNLAFVIERYKEDDYIYVKRCKTVDQAADI